MADVLSDQAVLAAGALSDAAAASAPALTLESALASLSVPLYPESAFRPWTCLCATLVLWVLLAIYINEVYSTAVNAIWFVWRKVLRRGAKGGQMQRGGAGPLLSGGNEQPWGTRMLLAYATLTPSKQAYWRRLQRSCLYYSIAVVAGFYFLLTHLSAPVDMYFVYTPAMELAFAAAATHFIVCCVEDYPCRSHMGRTKEEEMIVFYAYVFHHLLTSAAYLSCMYSHELATMCLLGLIFEGPVLLGCLREFVALYDVDFDLFDKIPRPLLALNWLLIFASLLPCRGVAISLFIYSAVNWQHYLALVSPWMRVGYYTFGTLFSVISMGFTWLLTFWYRQDKRYLRKKAAKKKLKETERQEEERKKLLGRQQQGGNGEIYSYTEEQQVSPVLQQQAQQRHQAQQHSHPHQTLHDSGHLAPMTRPLSPLLYAHPSPPSASPDVAASASPPYAGAASQQQYYNQQPQVVSSTQLPSAQRAQVKFLPQQQQQQQQQQWSNGYANGNANGGGYASSGYSYAQ